MDRCRWPWLLATVALHVAMWWLWPGSRSAPPVRVAPETNALLVRLIAEAAPSEGSTPLAPAAPALGRQLAPRPASPPPPAMEPLPEPPAVAVRPDRPALAVTAPDLSPLAGLPTPSAPIRLRLHIDADGRVNEVVPLEYALADEPFVRRLVEIWLATRHTPARLNGKDVASTKEIVLAANAA